MNRFLKVFGLFYLILFFAACKNDDDAKVAPPRDYGIQYASDKDSIDTFLKTHYVNVDELTLDATFHLLPNDGSKTSIWDQTEYPLKNIKVTKNDVEYTVYYLSFREGSNENPTLGDNISVTYRGTLLDGTQFDYRPIPEQPLELYKLVPGWGNIVPLFKTGIFVDVPGQPSSFTDYGAGAMFLPSGLAYFNASPNNLVPTYSCMVFTFQLLSVTYTDLDNDGILNKDETIAGIRIEDYDTDGDEKPDYLDTDDDGDGRLTKDELRIPGTTNKFYKYEDLFNEDGTVKTEHACPGGMLPKYLDPACKGGL